MEEKGQRRRRAGGPHRERRRAQIAQTAAETAVFLRHHQAQQTGLTKQADMRGLKLTALVSRGGPLLKGGQHRLNEGRPGLFRGRHTIEQTLRGKRTAR